MLCTSLRIARRGRRAACAGTAAVCQAARTHHCAELLGEPADRLVGVAVARPCAPPCAGRRAGPSCGCGRRMRGRSPAASRRSARARGTSRPGGARRRGCARLGESSCSRRQPNASQVRAWISSIERPRGRELRVEAGEHLAGELAGDRPPGQRAERDDADQRALERADVARPRAAAISSSASGATPRNVVLEHPLAQDRQPRGEVRRADVDHEAGTRSAPAGGPRARPCRAAGGRRSARAGRRPGAAR